MSVFLSHRFDLLEWRLFRFVYDRRISTVSCRYLLLSEWGKSCAEHRLLPGDVPRSLSRRERQRHLSSNGTSEGCGTAVLWDLCQGTLYGASVLFSGDLSYELREKDYPTEALEPHDLFVCEMAHFFPRHIEGELAASAIKSLAITHTFAKCENDVSNFLLFNFVQFGFYK